MKNLLLAYSLIVSFLLSIGQNTVGLIQNSGQPSEGLTLFAPSSNGKVFLIDECGYLVHSWEFNEDPGLSCYLLPNGNLLRAGKDSLQIRDWDNNVVWTYPTTANNIPQHHDIEPLPNGNVLCIVADKYTQAEMTQEGRDPSITNANFKLDKIVEIQPVGTNQANIVWEWKFKDHLIQDFDAGKNNFGVVIDHPELLDINYNNLYFNDYIHLNAVEYNENLDQIMISSRHLNELFIIDHSTTTMEAASHSGGNSNMGGDFLWRWGNPQVYRQGDSSNQMLWTQHDCRWIPNGYPEGGKISVFNNNGDAAGAYSSLHILDPVLTGGVYQKTNNRFDPQSYDWSWSGVVSGATMYESIKGALQVLPNGNKLIVQNSISQMAEIDAGGNVIWVYANPEGSSLLNQGDMINGQSNTFFRADRYSSSYAGFSGKDLTPIGLIEDVNQLSVNCASVAGIAETNLNEIQVVNPVINNFIEFVESQKLDQVSIYTLEGKEILTEKNFVGKRFLLSNIHSGIYFVRLNKANQTDVIKIIVE
ncbi:MAG: aryl-sulfate sulfotransferase [Crocinitomicaceae bacterium]